MGAGSGTLDTVADFNLTNPNSFVTINRNSPLSISWTGGDSRTYLTIQGLSYTASSSGAVSGAGFICIVLTSQGGFTVPVSILTQLPASQAISAGGFSIITRGSFSVTASGYGALLAPSDSTS